MRGREAGVSDFQGMEDMLQDFLTEAGELLSGVDNKLVELERAPGDEKLLNDIFRGFHTIKGGAGFLSVAPLVELCHLTENLFDLLRGRKLALNAGILDVILAATAVVREMFGALARQRQPEPADAGLLERLHAALRGEAAQPRAGTPVLEAVPAPAAELDWAQLYAALVGVPVPAPAAAAAPATETRHGRRASDQPGADGV